jgi:hypothetical protein
MLGMIFRLKLLGLFALEPLDGAAPVAELNRKTRAFLAYLAATGQPHSRQTLVDWFCSDAEDPTGTLRWHLSQIRRKVSPDVLQVTRQTAAINARFIQCDHLQFEAVINRLSDADTKELAAAVALYRGPFLAELTLKNAPEFELWQVGQRSRYQRLYEKGAAALIQLLQLLLQNRLPGMVGNSACGFVAAAIQLGPGWQNAAKFLHQARLAAARRAIYQDDGTAAAPQCFQLAQFVFTANEMGGVGHCGCSQGGQHIWQNRRWGLVPFDGLMKGQ